MEHLPDNIDERFQALSKSLPNELPFRFSAVCSQFSRKSESTFQTFTMKVMSERPQINALIKVPFDSNHVR